MSTQLSLEDKCRLLELDIDENLRRKRAVETRIRQRVQELKRLEVAIEKGRNKPERPGLGAERSKSWPE